MSFIANNPMAMAEVESPPSVPQGMRGIFAGQGGWYSIDSGNVVRKFMDETDFELLLGMIDSLYTKSLIETTTIELIASKWVKNSDNQYSQVVSIDNVTKNSKIDLQPTAEQLTIFHEKDVSFVTENENGVVTVYCIGRAPADDYTIQATISEVNIDG